MCVTVHVKDSFYSSKRSGRQTFVRFLVVCDLVINQNEFLFENMKENKYSVIIFCTMLLRA